MLKFKNKCKRGRGFPTIVGCVLALIMLFSPLSAFALDLTTNSYPIDSTTIPYFDDLYIQSQQLQHSVWLLFSPSEQEYYYLSWRSVLGSNADYQFILNNNTSSNQYNSFYFWIKDNQDNVLGYNNTGFGFIKSAPSGNGSWLDEELTTFTDGYNNQCCYFDFPNDVVLLARSMNPKAVNNDGEEIFVYYTGFEWNYFGNTSFSNMYLEQFPSVTTKFYIDNSGTIIDNGAPGSPDGEVTTSGITGLIYKIKDWLNDVKTTISSAINNIEGWLTTLKNGIVTAVGNIQGWLNTLGNTIGGFFTNLWTNHLQPAFTSIGNWFTNLGDRISNFFINLVNDIKGLFIPSDDFFTSWRTQFNNLLADRFGGLYQTMELNTILLNHLNDLFDYEIKDSLILKIPRLRVYIPFGRQRFYTILEEYTFDVNDYMLWTFNEDYIGREFDIWSIWEGFVNFVFGIGLFYQLKNKFALIMGYGKIVSRG